ncbi:MAG: YgiQ family radical SAM protein [Bacteroidales bacterium]
MSHNANYIIPTSAKEMKALGWEQADVILISGDAYVDHPAFGVAVLARMLQHYGYKVAIIPQPNWKDDLRDFKKLGKPRLFFGVSAGNMDSMVNHYTANRRLRSDDAYTAGGNAGFRPDYATIVYSNILKELFPDTPVIIGGIEASMRRFTHYDYWQNKLKKGILADTNADMLIYGMSEYPLIKVSEALHNHADISDIADIPQTQLLLKELPEGIDIVRLHDHKKCMNSTKAFADNFVMIEQNANSLDAGVIAQPVDGKWLYTNPPEKLLSPKKLDRIYDLPYTRMPHPRYKGKGDIPAYQMIRHSVNIHRGCFGGCAFCTIAAHQGKWIQSRSAKSVTKEATKITEMPDFKGYISDLGGPSANMYGMIPVDMNICRKCRRPSCIYPTICKNLNTDHKPMTELYSRVRKNPKVKQVTIGSGIRYDLIFNSPEKYRQKAYEYFRELVKYHISGRLKVAPEHTESKVLKWMRKPNFSVFEEMYEMFHKINKEEGKHQQLIPYFISSHPGCELQDMDKLARRTKDLNLLIEQVQDFTPTPMTLATVMYFTGIHPYTGDEIYVPKGKEKQQQRNVFFEKKVSIENKLAGKKRKK